jgi:hypothetical protein
VSEQIIGNQTDVVGVGSVITIRLEGPGAHSYTDEIRIGKLGQYDMAAVPQVEGPDSKWVEPFIGGSPGHKVIVATESGAPVTVTLVAIN